MRFDKISIFLQILKDVIDYLISDRNFPFNKYFYVSNYCLIFRYGVNDSKIYNLIFLHKKQTKKKLMLVKISR